jgi:energy-coupling factor transporter ATP-binding protein EcfA2
MGFLYAEIEDWLEGRPKWLQDAARRIANNPQIGKDDIEELIALCKAEVGITNIAHKNLKPITIRKGGLQGSQKRSSLRLDEIGDLRGINALHPRVPLQFGAEQLTIVYGQNGSGKSGYVRALKHACGTRKPGVLHGDVFSAAPQGQSCRFKYVVDGVSKESTWSSQLGPIEELRAVQIYDNNCAHIYVNEENEVAFEPFLLRLFTALTDLCGLVSNKIETEIKFKPTKKPMLPIEFQASETANWFASLSHRTTTTDINDKCTWTEESSAELEELTKRLAETHPAQKAIGLRRQKSQLTIFEDELDKWSERLSDANCQLYIAMRDEAASKRKIADVDANMVFANAPLKGVGSESWKSLWEQARIYSEREAYLGIPFPNTSEDANCVLCQQPLGIDAKRRFKSFEAFVKGGLEAQAAAAEAQAVTQWEDLSGISPEDLKLRLDSVGVVDEAERGSTTSFCARLEDRRQALIAAKGLSDVPTSPARDLIKFIGDRSRMLEQQALAFDEDAKGENRPTLNRKCKELETQKWLSQQRASIGSEVGRLKEVRLLEEAKKLTSTQALSMKKSTLADELITSAYVKRFQDGLDALHAPHIRVQIVKTRTEKGHVYHQILLNNSKKPAAALEVLSEGEFRIVSLAAFLSDVEAREESGPFIFDDPISSLDQAYEEATVARLVELSQSRQVIVFTHRLSLMALLDEAAKKSHIDVRIIALRVESWGVGEPSETPIHAKKPAPALSELLGRIGRARKILSNSSSDYEIIAKAICSDFRNVIERMVELTLLSDVVQRFRRSIITKSKIHRLAKISNNDCQLFDDLMTEYSKYEHSQPSETPISLPDPNTLEKDVRRAMAWIIEFENR